jgi:hypothetical protein
MPFDQSFAHVAGLEARFAHDTTRQFLARSRAAHQVAVWAAHQAGQDSDQAERYARAVVAESVHFPEIEQVARRISRDLAAHQSGVDECEIEQKLRVKQAMAWSEM